MSASKQDAKNQVTTIRVPKIISVAAGTENIDVSDAITETIHVYGLNDNGVICDKELEASAIKAVAYVSYKLSNGRLSVPSAGTDTPLRYIIKYDRSFEAEILFSNLSNKFPESAYYYIRDDKTGSTAT